MSDDSQALTDLIEGAKKRFEVYVPEPAARFNLGQAAPASAVDGQFGYTGASLAVKDDMFLSADASTVVQGRGQIVQTTGGDHSTYALGSVHTYANSTMTTGAKGQMLFAVGTVGNSPHGVPTDDDVLYTQSANSIAVHYRIDSIQTSLFEFLHGRRQHDAGKFNRKKATDEILKDAELKGGFTQNLHRSLQALYPVEASKDVFFPSIEGGRDKDPTPVPELEDPVRWVDTLFREGKWDKRKDAVDAYPYLLFGGDDIDELEWGFSEYLAMFDPYRMWNPDSFKNKWLKKKIVPLGFNAIQLLNFSVVLRRLRDTLNLFFFEKKSYFGKGSKVVGAVGGLFTAVGGVAAQLQTLAENPPIPPGQDPFAAPLSKAVADDPAAAPAEEEPAQSAYIPSVESAAASRHATLTLPAGTYDLSSQQEWPLFIESDLGGLPFVLETGARDAEPAELVLPIAPPAEGATGYPVRLVLRVNGVSKSLSVTEAMHADPALIAQEVEAKFGGALEPVSVIQDDTAAQQQAQADFDAATDAAPERGPGDSPTGGIAPGIDGVLQGAGNLMGSATEGLHGASSGVGDSAHEAFHADSDTKHIKLTTTRTGSSASIVVTSVTPEGEPLALEVGARGDGHPAQAAIADPGRVTLAEIVARMPSSPYYSGTMTPGGYVMESPTAGNGSRLHLEGGLADALMGGPATDTVVESDTAANPFAPKTFHETMGMFRHLGMVLSELPAHFQKLLKPYLAKLDDAIARVEKLGARNWQIAKYKAKAQFGRIVYPPENIGLVAPQGISLATSDRILGVGGHGVLFVVDGGSAGPDKAKVFNKQDDHIPPRLRSAMKVMGKIPEMTLTKPVVKQPWRATKQASMGFRVLSDTVAALDATLSAQLFAMGRGKATEARPDGETIAGLGIARVMGSRATEVTGYEKVVISARSAGESSDTDGKTGGRVEVAGQTIAIGAMNFEEENGDGEAYGPNDLFVSGDAEHHQLGIAPFEIEDVAGLEHIRYDAPATPPAAAMAALAKLPGPIGKKFGPKGPGDDPGTDHLDMSMYCWPEKLRKEHPATERVYVHATKETVMQGGKFIVAAIGDVGVGIGARLANEDAYTNDLDPASPQWLLTDADLTVLVPPDGGGDPSTFVMTAADITATVGADGSGSSIVAEDGTITLSAGGSTSVTVDGSAGLALEGSTIDVKGGTVKIKGTIHLG